MRVTKSGLVPCSSSLVWTLELMSPGRISIIVLAASFLMLLFLIGPRGKSGVKKNKTNRFVSLISYLRM